MLSQIIKILFVFVIGFLGAFSSAFAQSKARMDEAAQYYDDLTGEGSLKDIKSNWKLDTQRLREAILKSHQSLQRDDSDLAKAVVDHKVKIAREREFLSGEFDAGVSDLYQKAVTEYQHKQFIASLSTFEEVESLSPDFKDTRKYLQKLAKTQLKTKAKIASGQQIKMNEESRDARIDKALKNVQYDDVQGDIK